MTTVTLSQIAKSLKVNPKIARRRLRNLPKLPKLVGDGSRWVFSAKERPVIAAAIKG